jgi:hypothetical protein
MLIFIKVCHMIRKYNIVMPKHQAMKAYWGHRSNIHILQTSALYGSEEPASFSGLFNPITGYDTGGGEGGEAGLGVMTERKIVATPGIEPRLASATVTNFTK